MNSLVKTTASIIAFASTILLARPALAQEAEGHWAVAGVVEGKTFTLDCQFQKTGQALSGACIDGPTGDSTVPGGKSHPLTEGNVTGENISWTYQSSYMFIKFDVKYVGILKDGHISGSISAAGKTGTFTADRVKP